MFTSEAIRHVSAISLYVADVARSKAFYQRVFEAQVVHEDARNVVIKFENLFLNLLDMQLAYAPTDPQRGPLPLELNIWVEDVDAAYQALLERGLTFLAPPTDQPWGMRNITFFDPDGHRFELAKAIGQEGKA